MEGSDSGSDFKYLNEREILKPVSLCDSEGMLKEESIGWSREPIIDCSLRKRWLRKKKWNYWCIISDNCLFSVTISNFDYLGMISIYYLDFKRNKFMEETETALFGRKFFLPNNVNDDIEYNGKFFRLSVNKEQNCYNMKVEFSREGREKLHAEIWFKYPENHETLNVVVPWSRKKYQYTSKHNCISVSGHFIVGEKNYEFQEGNTFACFDFGRGVWPYNTEWNWASFSGISNGRSIGVNLGGKWTDMSGISENSFIVDGKITKISQRVQFSYDSKDFMKPWKIKSNVTNKVCLKFIPFYKRTSETDALFFKCKINQMIGRFSGSFINDEGERVEFKDIIGIAEECKARW